MVVSWWPTCILSTARPGFPVIVGIDATGWTHPRGFGRHVRELTRAVLRLPTRHRFVLFVDDHVAAEVLPPDAQVVRLPLMKPADRQGPHRAVRRWRDLRATARRLGSSRIDVAYFPSLLGYVPLRLPTVVVVHDAIGHLFPRSAFRTRRSALAWRLKSRIALARAVRVVTVSEHARASICTTLHVDPGIVRIVGEAPAEGFTVMADREAVQSARVRSGVPAAARTVVYHGGFAPHKNIERLVRVFAQVADKPWSKDVHLVLVGAGPDDGSVCSRLLAGCRSEVVQRIRVLGRRCDRELAALLNAATMAVLPSLEEGFGLTGIEAVACGAPLAATSKSAMPEVLGPAAVYFDPFDDATLEAALTQVLDDAALRDRLRTAGLNIVRRLTWARAAEQLLSVFDEIESEVERC